MTPRAVRSAPRPRSTPIRRTLARLVALVAAWAVATVGCARPDRGRTVVERIAGVARVRSFASGTAYEAFLRSEVALLRGDLAEASRQIELATFADESDGWLLARHSEVLLRAEQPEEALEVAERCARRWPAQSACWIVLGACLNARTRTAEATAAFSRALAVAPDDPEVRAAVALGQGASARTAARASEGAPDARDGDRTVAQRSLLDAGRDARPTLPNLRRERARAALARGAFRVADALLTPLYHAGRATLEDRLRLIDARVGDGRPADALGLVEGLAVGEGSRGISRVERAARWLSVQRPAQALEDVERARAEGSADPRTRLILGVSLSRLGRAEQALTVLATIAPEDREFVEAQIEAAEALSHAGRAGWADESLRGALSRIGPGPGRAVDRDRLRHARSELLGRRGDPQAALRVLEDVESPWGRHRRGIARARAGEVSEALADLRVRSDERGEDARADGHRALLCLSAPARCEAEEGARALRSALDGAAEAPATLRAVATTVSPAEARALRAWADAL
jgi:tetratricopeptide (TPR) repeat protein